MGVYGEVRVDNLTPKRVEIFGMHSGDGTFMWMSRKVDAGILRPHDWEWGYMYVGK